MSVPDLSRLRQQEKPLLAITVKPGDRVMVLLPRHASAMDVEKVTQALNGWAPQTEFLVMSGPESITVIPAQETLPRDHHPTDVLDPEVGWICTDECPPVPVEDKAPQGQMTDAELVAYAKQKAAELYANDAPKVYYRCQRDYAKVGEAAHAAVDCPGPPECV